MAANSGFGNVLRYNTFEKIGYNGIDVFGPETTIEKNLITQTCYSKADCGAVRVFGSGSLASTTVYNIHLIDNLIVDIPGNVDGCHASRAAMGMGLYVDNYSRDVETRGNTIIDTTATGILYQRSSGQISGNNVFNASIGDGVQCPGQPGRQRDAREHERQRAVRVEIQRVDALRRRAQQPPGFG